MNENPDAGCFDGVPKGAAGVVGAAANAAGADTDPNTEPELKILAEVASVVAGAELKAPRETAVVAIAPNGVEAVVVLVTTAPNGLEAFVAVAAELKGAAEVAVVVSTEPNRELEMPKRPAEGVALDSELVTTVMGVIVSPEGVLSRAGAGVVAAAVVVAADKVSNEKVAAGVELNGAGVAAVVVGVATTGVEVTVAAGGVDTGVAVEAGVEPKMETPLLAEGLNEKVVTPLVGVDTASKANLGVLLMAVAAVEAGVANRVEPEKRLGFDEGVAVEKKLLLLAGEAREDEANGSALGVAEGVGDAGLACRIEARIGDDAVSTKIK